MPSASEPSSHASCPPHLASHSWFLPLSASSTSHMVSIKEDESREGGNEGVHNGRGRGGGQEGGRGRGERAWR